MAKDSRKIFSGIRIDNKVFTDGMEDELEAALDSAQLQRLTDKGAIEGFAVKKAKPVEVSEETTTEESTEESSTGEQESEDDTLEEKPKGRGRNR